MGRRRDIVGLALIFSGCAPSSREIGASGSDASIPACGNGIYEPITNLEGCDLGPLNGQPGSTCSKQCRPAPVEGFGLTGIEGHIPLGGIPARAVGIRPDWGYSGIAFTSFDSSGIQIVPNIWTQNFFPGDQAGTVPPKMSVRVAADPVALGNVYVRDSSGLLPIWVEAPKNGETVPRMYFADVASDYTAVAHEITYPFADGTHPELIASDLRKSIMVVDQSGIAPYDLLIAVITIRNAGDWTATALRLNAPGRARGAAVETTLPEDPNAPWTQRVVQFFDDTNTFVAVADLEPPDGPFGTMPYQLFEAARGSWPFRVVAGDQWIEGCNDQGTFTDPPPPALTHPYPLAVLTDTGDIYTWQFGAQQEGLPSPRPFAHVAPGSNALRTWEVDWSYNNYVNVLQPDGTVLAFMDADCQDLSSGALKPMDVKEMQPWSSASAVAGARSLTLGGSVVDGWYVPLP